MNLNKKVMVIDDDPDILEAIRISLQREGYSVTATENGGQLEQIRGNNMPSLIILDILLSGSDGRLICKKLKRQEVTKRIPVIMISAYPDIEHSVKMAGANDFLAKPFDIKTLVSRVKKYIN